MDPHSIKRPRIMPPEARSSDFTAPSTYPLLPPSAKATPTAPSYHTTEPSPTHQRLSVNTTAVGLNASTAKLPNAMFASANRSLLTLPGNSGTTAGAGAQFPEGDAGLVQRGSYSNRHSKDTLFHKNTHHRHPPKQQQTQIERENKYRQQLRLQQAHQEFHRQRELYQIQQQQQQPQQLMLQQRAGTSSLSSSSPSMSIPLQGSAAQPQHYHHHHHHHHYHVRPLVPNVNAQLRQLNTSTTAMAPSTSQYNEAASASSISSASSSPSLQSSTPLTTPGSSSTSSLLSSPSLHHHHHHHHHGSLHQHLPQRPNQFSEWTNVKERERARLLSNVARARDAQSPLPSAEAAKENLRRLSQRIHQRRTRARETILYDLHQGVKTVEAQVHKQVEMVLSRLKDAPGSKYAFALTHTFLTQLPQALSNTILPSAISAVADTVAGRTTNSLTTLRGRAGLDEFDEDDEDEDDEDEDLDDIDDLEELSYQQQLALMRLHQRQDSGVSQQLSNEFGTIALVSSSSSAESGSGPSSSPSSSSSSGGESSMKHAAQSQAVENNEGSSIGAVSISKAGASEFLAASTHHNYSIAASQVLNAALPSFIPSMVAPIVCVFSYPSPPTSKTNTPSQSAPSSPDSITSVKGKEVASDIPMRVSEREPELDFTPIQQHIKQEDEDDEYLRAALRADPGIAAVTSTAWTTAEREALFLAATRFRLRGQWSRIRQMMGLHRTDKEIESEYQRLYGETDDEDEDVGLDLESQGDQEMQTADGDMDLVPIKQEGDEEDYGDADDEAEATIFMRFGGHHHHNRRPSSILAPISLSLVPQGTQYIPPSQDEESILMAIEPLPTITPTTTIPPPPTTTTTTTTTTAMANSTTASQRSPHRHAHHHRLDRGHHYYRRDDRILRTLNEKSLRVIKKEFMIDKRFALEDIPMRL